MIIVMEMVHCKLFFFSVSPPPPVGVDRSPMEYCTVALLVLVCFLLRFASLLGLVFLCFIRQ